MEKGLPAKREITFETELFGSKTFLIYVEPVFSKAGETIGINYMGMDITDQVNVVVVVVVFFFLNQFNLHSFFKPSLMACNRCSSVSYTHLTLPTNREV